MKILLINPSQENFLNYKVGWKFGLKDAGYYQPLGILYIATYLKTKMPDIDIELIDAASPDLPYQELENKIDNSKPDIVGIAAYTQTFIDTVKTAKIVKKINLSIHICIGGNHLFYFPKESLSHKEIDSIILGDGEIRFYELVKNIKNKQPIEQIQGVFTKKNSESLNNNIAKNQYFIRNIDELPFPDRNLLKEYNYYNILTLNRKMTTIISSRGCPYNCTFCPQANEWYRQRTAEKVVDEIEYCSNQGFTDFFFVEDTFNKDKFKVVRFCTELINRKVKIGWCCKARANSLDYETLKLMKRSGCYLINLGIETGNDTGLKELKKGITVKMITEVINNCKKLKIKTFAYFMIGLPSEKTANDVKKNINFLLSLKPNYININPFAPLPYTALFDTAVSEGFLSYEPWREYIRNCQNFEPLYWEKYITKDEILKLRTEGILRFYFRLSYIIVQLFKNISIKQFIYMTKVASNILKGYITEKSFK